MVFSCPWHVTSSGTRDQTRVPYIGRQILNRWTTREVSGQWIFKAGVFTANISFYYLFIFKFIYLAGLSLSYSTQALQSLLQHMRSVVAATKLLVAAYELLVVACGI